MRVKISSRVLSISPYLSTEWKNISLMQTLPDGKLLIHLYNGNSVEIPSLDSQALDAIFEAHARYTEKETLLFKNPLESPYSFTLPISSNGGILPAMAHNPEQANIDPLPPEVLQKIGLITKALGFDDANVLPQAEPHCNCLYCQVTRAMHGEVSENCPAEEWVDEKELTFRTWDISQSGEKLYIVTNPLDPNEQYNVFLGDPLGCTCGSKNCEHLRAVLSS